MGEGKNGFFLTLIKNINYHFEDVKKKKKKGVAP